MDFRWAATLGLACAVAASPGAAAGQTASPGARGPTADPRGEVFVHLGVADPTGEFQRHVDVGFGGRIGGLLHVGEAGGGARVALRGDLGFVVYGVRRTRVPLSSTVSLVEVNQETTNSILSVTAGPQVRLGTGPVRPYAFVGVGFAHFATRTSARGTHSLEPIASTTNFGDFQLALRGGGGLAVALRRGRRPVALDLSAAYQYNGPTEYLVDGGLRARPNGWSAEPVRSDANFMTYGVGVSFAVR